MPTAADTDVKHHQGVPEILELENKEERRVQDKLASFADKESDTQRKNAEDVHAATVSAQTEADAELAAFREQELAKILQAGEKEREDQLKKIDAAYKKNAAGALAALVERAADPAHLS